MNNLTPMQKGLYLAMLTAVISGLSVFLNKFAVSAWSNSSVFTTGKNLMAVVFLISVMALFGKFSELKNLPKKDWFLLVVIGFIGGSLPFLLFFKGLSLTSAASAAFIHKTLFIWVALMATPFLKEKLSNFQFLALGMLLASIYLFGSPAKFKFGYGEFLVLLATLFWAMENIIAKIMLRNVSSLAVGWGRMFFGSAFLLIYLFFAGGLGQLFVFSGVKIFWLILAGALLFGYVVSWYRALKLAPATAVSAILAVGAPITILLDSIFSGRWNKAFILPAIMTTLAVLIFCRFFEKLFYFLKRRGWYGRWLVDVR